MKNIIEHSISKQTDKELDNLKLNSHLYQLIDTKSIEELGEVLKNNLPGYSELIESIPNRIRANIFNYSDFKKAYIGYGLSYNELDNENRKIVNQLIKDNIKKFISNYNRSVKRKVVKQVKKKKKILSNKEKYHLVATISWE